MDVEHLEPGPDNGSNCTSLDIPGWLSEMATDAEILALGAVGF
jgi:hypothetical protein